MLTAGETVSNKLRQADMIIIIIISNILRSLLRRIDKPFLKTKNNHSLSNNHFIRKVKGIEWVVCELIERVNKLDQV